MDAEEETRKGSSTHTTEWNGFHHKQALAAKAHMIEEQTIDFGTWLSPIPMENATAFTPSFLINDNSTQSSNLHTFAEMQANVQAPHPQVEEGEDQHQRYRHLPRNPVPQYPSIDNASTTLGQIAPVRQARTPGVPAAMEQDTRRRSQSSKQGIDHGHPRQHKMGGASVPSTAIYVKNIKSSTTEKELAAVFGPYVAEAAQIMIVPYFERGVAFIDLGSTEAVMNAVSVAKSDGISIGDSLLTVEPSKKPVRASGLRAMHVRKRGDNLVAEASTKSIANTFRGRWPGAPMSSRDPGARCGVCWVVQESFLHEGRSSSSMPTRRIVGVFVHKEQAIAAANALWMFLKSSKSSVGGYSYQEIREDSQNGNFYRRLETALGHEIRQVNVEAPAYLNPVNHELRECTTTCIEPEIVRSSWQPPQHTEINP